MKDPGPEPHYSPPVLTAQEAEALATAHGLTEAGVRPGLSAYIADVWRHRDLMWSLAKGEFISEHQDNYLGFLWAVINPLLLGAAYYLIFGLLLGTSRGIENFITFLTAGLFTFALLSTALTSGSKSLLSRMTMMRSLQFPRVLLPVVTVLSAMVRQLPAFVVLLVIALWQQGSVSWTWALYPVALLIVTTMGLGMAMLTARLVHASRDLVNLVPLLVRLLRYVSGVFFSVSLQMERFSDPPRLVALALEYQPVAVALTMVRESIMSTEPLRWETWAVATGWALVLFVGGFVYFWGGEGRYGRA